jgi:hypothetical protein
LSSVCSAKAKSWGLKFKDAREVVARWLDNAGQSHCAEEIYTASISKIIRTASTPLGHKPHATNEQLTV